MQSWMNVEEWSKSWCSRSPNRSESKSGTMNTDTSIHTTIILNSIAKVRFLVTNL